MLARGCQRAAEGEGGDHQQAEGGGSGATCTVHRARKVHAPQPWKIETLRRGIAAPQKQHMDSHLHPPLSLKTCKQTVILFISLQKLFYKSQLGRLKTSKQKI